MAVFYRPPADIDDYPRSAQEATLRQNWHDYMSGLFADRDSDLFYDAANDPTPGATPARLPIPWNGFPRSIWQWFNADSDPAGPSQAFQTAEVLNPFTWVAVEGDGGQFGLGRQFPSATVPPLREFAGGALGAALPSLSYRQQDEYCEWHVDRVGGHISRISYTVEGPEYWERMAEVDMSLVTTLYQELVDPSITTADLVWATDVACPFFGADGSFMGYGLAFSAGSYNPNNKWNTTNGAVHLTHPANTLGAEINLGADGTTLFPAVAPAPANTFASRLICCAGFGGVNRSSDPAIGAAVNGLAQAGHAVTLENPVGLYISSVDLNGLANPMGTAIPEALVVRRQSPDGEKILRIEVRPPAGATYTLDECTLDFAPVTSGGPIAKKITMSLFGLAKTIPGRVAATEVCNGKCCSRPSSPSFARQFPPTQNCASLGDSNFPGPFTGQTPAPPVQPNIAAVAEAVSLGQAPVLHVDAGAVSKPAPSRTAM